MLFSVRIDSAEPVKSHDMAKTIGGKTAAQLHQEGLVFFQRKEYEKAMRVWLQEFELDPRNANTANNIGIAYKEMGNYDAAIEYHKKAIALSPDFGHAHYSIGLAYFFKGQDEKAIDSFQRAIGLKYRIGVSYYNLGLAYRRLGEYKQASMAFSKAITYGYDHQGGCYYELGLSYFMLDQFDKCMEAMNKAEQLNPMIEGIHYFKGVCYKKKGLCLRALYEFRKASQYKHRYFKENTDFQVRTMFDMPEKVGCRDIDAIIYFFTGLIPIGFLFLMRNRRPFLKLGWKKAITFGILMLLIPMPLYLVFLVGIIPSVYVLKIGINISLTLESVRILGVLFTLLHYVLSITLNYLIVCALCNRFRQKNAFWIINSAFLLIGFLMPTYWLADAGGGRHVGRSYFEIVKGLLIAN